MIRFSLICSNRHGFEGWFRSSDDYDRQADEGSLECPICGDQEIAKAIMAPAIARGRSAGGVDGPCDSRADAQKGSGAEQGTGSGTKAGVEAGDGSGAALPAAAPAAAAMVDTRAAQAYKLMRKMREHIEKNFENVGDRFASEARAMHCGETKTRDIYGRASVADARSLHEDGISVLPIPDIPKLDG